jgi:hypothetical protein
MKERRLERREVAEDFDPLLDMPPRKLHFEDAVDESAKDSADKVKDKFVETGNDTRNTDQYVKLVNAHIKNKVSTLERIKQAQRKFEQEVDMFNVNSQETDQDSSAPPQSLDVESVLIIRELSTMINKYGIERISKALDQILSKP